MNTNIQEALRGYTTDKSCLWHVSAPCGDATLCRAYTYVYKDTCIYTHIYIAHIHICKYISVPLISIDLFWLPAGIFCRSFLIDVSPFCMSLLNWCRSLLTYLYVLYLSTLGHGVFEREHVVVKFFDCFMCHVVSHTWVMSHTWTSHVSYIYVYVYM